MFPTPFYDEQNLNIPFSRIMANPKLISVLNNSTFFVLKNIYGVNLTDAKFLRIKVTSLYCVYMKKISKLATDRKLTKEQSE